MRFQLRSHFFKSWTGCFIADLLWWVRLFSRFMLRSFIYWIRFHLKRYTAHHFPLSKAEITTLQVLYFSRPSSFDILFAFILLSFFVMSSAPFAVYWWWHGDGMAILWEYRLFKLSPHFIAAKLKRHGSIIYYMPWSSAWYASILLEIYDSSPSATDVDGFRRFRATALLSISPRRHDRLHYAEIELLSPLI